MPTASAKLTTQMMWAAALVVALVDAAFVFLLARHVRPERFRQLPWLLEGTAAIVFGGLWALFASVYYWDACYRFIFPSWARWCLPVIYAVVFGLVGAVLWWLSPRLPGNATLDFCLLGGLVSLPGHSYAIYAKRMFEQCALLRGVSPASALVFGVFEFIFYWSVILTLAVLLRRASEPRSPLEKGA